MNANDKQAATYTVLMALYRVDALFVLRIIICSIARADLALSPGRSALPNDFSQLQLANLTLDRLFLSRLACGYASLPEQADATQCFYIDNCHISNCQNLLCIFSWQCDAFMHGSLILWRVEWHFIWRAARNRAIL